MAYIAVDKNGEINIFTIKPVRNIHENIQFCYWKRSSDFDTRFSKISKRICKELIGKVLTWEDEPVKI